VDPGVDSLMLDRRVALVTGAARGIGRETASLLLRRGAQVALFDRSADELATAVEELGSAALAIAGDVTEADDAARAVAAAVQRFGRLDILINNAGIAGHTGNVWELDVADWRTVIDVNLTGQFLFCRVAVPAMLANGYGRIVNVASIAGKEGNPTSSHYSASKAGVIALTKALGKELATSGILVNAIAPAVIRTEILTRDGIDPAFLGTLLAKVPMQRIGETAEVATLIGYLASEQLSFSTGAVYDLSGGRATY
jgi:NAD(P)-dependent dehydrogenase (short-subunit alcohol dehydrogenase family)